MPSASRLRFKVVSFSSEDKDHPALELNTVNPSTKGWHSVRFCSYPQELGFELIDGDARMSEIQILSHQAKIASKIEIYVGQGGSYTTAKYKRLGYLSLDSNERSNFSARELKTVFVDFTGRYLKLIIDECHVNSQNIYNQVGIIAVSIMGSVLNGNDDYDAKSSSSSSLSKQARRYGSDNSRSPVNNNPYNDLSVDLNLDPQTAAKLRQLAEAKMRAIEEEDYLTAKEIKAMEEDLKVAGAKLAQIDLAKSNAVREEDYDRAKELKDEADIMRDEIEQKIMSIRIPGVNVDTKAQSKQPSHHSTPKFAASYKDDGGYSNPFDNQVVGGGGAGAGGGAPSSGGKRIAKVEAHHHPSYDDSMSGAMGQFAAEADPYYADDQDANLSPMDRPIKPKALGYNDPTHLGGDIDDDPNAFRGGPAGGGPAKNAMQFPPGEHPLEGVPRCGEFEIPETFGSAKNKEVADSGGITALLGEHRAKSLDSSSLNMSTALDMAASRTVQVLLMFRDELSRDPGVAACLPSLCGVIRVGVEDKIQQVVFGAVQLMEDVLQAVKSAKLPRATVAPLFDGIIMQLLEKQNDGNARLREGGRKGLDVCAAATNALGPQVVASHALRPIPAKQKTAWRPLFSRIKLLADLVKLYGLSGVSGLNHDTLLALPKSSGAYAHSNADVRNAAMELVVNIQKITGTAAVEGAMTDLRAKQREEYEHAFIHGMPVRNADGTLAEPKAAPSTGGTGAKAGGGGAKQHQQDKSGGHTSRTDKHLQHATQSPGGQVQTSAAKVANSRDGYDAPSHNDNSNQDGGQPQQDFTSCMFCGVHDAKWTENDLDAHYWKDCPLLISCPSCAQIVEIAGLPEHQLDECDAKDSYVPCDVTGLAIRTADMDAWKHGGNCKPAPANCMYCPLCLASVEDSDEAWLSHLQHGCPRNARTNGSGQH